MCHSVSKNFRDLTATGTIYVLSFEKLVNVYAFTALTFVLVYVGGVLVLKESITFNGAVGIFLVLLGLYLITQVGPRPN